MDRKKGLISAIGVLIVLIGLIYVSTWKDFDAKGYVQAVLSQTLQGDVTQAATMIANATEEELLAQYEFEVESFMDKNILSGVETTDEVREQYKALCKDIFKAMKYEATGVKKISRKEYEVTVTYYETDIMQKFVEDVAVASKKLLDNATSKYTGTKEENIKNMEKDFLNQSYELLKNACANASYGDAETYVFSVKSDENNIFSVDEAQISEFIVKILMIDEIQD